MLCEQESALCAGKQTNNKLLSLLLGIQMSGSLSAENVTYNRQSIIVKRICNGIASVCGYVIGLQLVIIVNLT